MTSIFLLNRGGEKEFYAVVPEHLPEGVLISITCRDIAEKEKCNLLLRTIQPTGKIRDWTYHRDGEVTEGE